RFTPTTDCSMQRRDDIDGLRAFAVLSIVLFHAGLSFLSGGFVGVDIFFVISGFLITTLIWDRLDTNRFSLLEFYRRRIVRIFPALFLMIMVVLIGGWFFLLPAELTELCKSAIATLLFVSNIFFWLDLDYFSPAAELVPLLHTWSL